MDDVHGGGEGYRLEDLVVGMTAAYEHTVTERDVVSFADVSGDHNPVHLDEAYARSTRFKGRIVHGMLSASFLATAIASRLPGPGTIYLTQNLSFRAPVRIGDKVEARVTVQRSLAAIFSRRCASFVTTRSRPPIAAPSSPSAISTACISAISG